MKTTDLAQRLIAEECDAVKDLLLRKNREYGNSALEPKRIFSSGKAEDLIRTRIDDKLSRIATINQGDVKMEIEEDTEQDLLGYLIFLRVAKRWEKICEECGNENGHFKDCKLFEREFH